MPLPRALFRSLQVLVIALWCASLSAQTYTAPSTSRATLNFNADWIYYQGDVNSGQTIGFNDDSWSPVGLPHATALVTQDNTEPYIGVSWYRKHFTVSSAYSGLKVFLQFGAAMQSADVWVNGTQVITQHVGGYTPFTADVTSLLNYGGGDNVVAVRIDSDPNSNWAPGWAGVDFRYFGGLYRDVFMVVTNPLHVTDAVYAKKAAGGGIFVTYPSVSTAAATVSAQTDVLNETGVTRNVTVVSTLVDASGNTVQTATTTLSLAAGAHSNVSQTLPVSNPHLWHPYTPYLYTLNTVIQDGATNVDYVKTNVGIRQIQWLHDGGFVINGSQFLAHGADYHQDVYLLGNAMPAAEIYQDVKRMKDAGLDFVRGSHYPHNPAFYDACDQLGMLVMDSITGWQYYNDATVFQNNTFQECQDLIRRDRNHPSVVLWETSLNESNYTTDWASAINALAHAEYPGNQMYTTGWATTVFDTYCASSQSGVRSSTDPRPIIIDEYGSWDFGGLETTSAVAREGTETDLLQQCTNFTLSENENLAQSWFSADSVWVFGDYAGYTNYTVSTLGMVDWTRLPKFSYYYYKSQRDPTVSIPNVDSGPMVYIANYYQPNSPTTVRVFSNCEQVSLYQDNVLVATQSPDTDYPYLPHPPFTFNLSSYVPGTLQAVGLINGVKAATTSRSTAGSSTQIVLTPDATTAMNADGGDARLVFISVEDANGQVVPTSMDTISLAATGQGQVVGPTTVQMRAGQMATWVQAGRIPGTITLTATGAGLNSATANFTAVAVPGLAPLSPPAAPTGLTGTATVPAQVTLAWKDNSTNENSFIVEHSADDITFTPVLSVPANSTTASFAETEATLGTYYYEVVAQNAAGNSSPSNVLPLAVSATPLPPAPVISSAGSAAGQVGVAFNYQLTATNTPTSFSASGLPAGLVMSVAGQISGAPTVPGTFAVTLGATNAGGTGKAGLALTILPAAPVITSPGHTTGRVGEAFKFQITAVNGPTSFAAVGLPVGLALNTATGMISGVPHEAGIFHLPFTVRNSGGTAGGTLDLIVASKLPVITLHARISSVVVGSEKPGQITVALSAAQDAPFVVHYRIKGDAENGKDYDRLPGTLKIPRGKTEKVIDIRPLGDLEGAAEKTVKLILEAGDSYTVGAKSSAEVKIRK